MTNNMKRILSIGILLLGAAFISQAKVQLAPVFADNMVLQQQSEAAVWGKAEPGVKITITTTWSKAKTVVNAGEDGRWSARIATPVAGGPYEITFNDGDKVTLKNVLIGEVWVCLGQSNMEMPMKGFAGQPVDGSTELIIGAKPSVPIRSCKFTRTKALEPQDSCEVKWYLNDPEGVAEASATAYMFAKRLYDVLGLPIGIINVSWGGTPIEAWMNEDVLKKEFGSEFKFTHLDTKTWPERGPHQKPAVLYNGMLHSLIPFTAKGFIWYQGCANRNRYEQYTRLQPAFVKMLRQEWGNEDMPFYFTQIAPYQYDDPDGTVAGYMMWAQAQTLKMIPKSGMAVTHDAGEKACIHPANKKVVGDRLAFLALTEDYGVKGIEARSPMPEKYEFKNGKAYVSFSFCRLGISPINMEIDGFELAGADRKFYPAKATVCKDRKSIEVSSPEVAEPVAVRYGMRNWSEATLFNCSQIPVTPFRSDDWK